ncbi:MAG: glycine zipper family protein [Chloroflexota bacterium]
MNRSLVLSVLVIAATLSACATIPTGPSVMSLPGTGKSFEQFRMDDLLCRQFAYEQVGGVSAQQAGQNAAVGSAVAGTALGAAAGAAIGSASGNLGAGAAIGAASGLILGTAVGGSYASASYYENQRRYDNAYIQCMYAKGNRVPVQGQFTAPPSSTTPRYTYPPPASYPPPPE